jgi:hypothetical protein
MGNPVFANAMEISSKAMGGKSICQFPDVCFTPPLTPATPPGVPIPYPNTGMASDTSDGSRSVNIGGQEIMLKDRSAFKQSTGDEAGAAPKKGIINSKIKGKVYFIAWSMDVKVEGENVVRHLDMTTHNHASFPANGSAPMSHVAKAAMGSIDSCAGDRKKIKNNCKKDASDQCPGLLNMTVKQQKKGLRRKKGDSRTKQAAERATKKASGSKCVNAMRCFLRPYKPGKDKAGCCPGQTPHHVPPKSMMKKISGYQMESALCVCLEGASQHVGSHGKNHAAIDYSAKKSGKLNRQGCCSLADYNAICAKAVAAQCACNENCIKQQLDGQIKPKSELGKSVKHWESSSKQLDAGLKKKLNQAYESAFDASLR